MSKLCKFPFVHSWERYVPKETPTLIKITKHYFGSVLGGMSEELEYNTVVTRLTRYCERCGDKQVKHADLIHVRVAEKV